MSAVQFRCYTYNRCTTYNITEKRQAPPPPLDPHSHPTSCYSSHLCPLRGLHAPCLLRTHAAPRVDRAQRRPAGIPPHTWGGGEKGGALCAGGGGRGGRRGDMGWQVCMWGGMDSSCYTPTLPKGCPPTPALTSPGSPECGSGPSRPHQCPHRSRHGGEQPAGKRGRRLGFKDFPTQTSSSTHPHLPHFPHLLHLPK